MDTSKISNYSQTLVPKEIGKKLMINNDNKSEKVIEDSLMISEDGKRKAKDAKEELARLEREKEELQRQVENIKKQNEAQAEEMNKRLKCLTIAMRIMSGDKVPKEDHRYLSKNDPELYGRAIMMKVNIKDPKKYKRLSEDEESENGNQESSASSKDSTKVMNEGSESTEVQVEGSVELSTVES